MEVWAEDEHRPDGLQPVLRRVWFWLYGFVHPREGETFWLLLPHLDGAWLSRAPEDLAKWVRAGEHTEIGVVVDKAGAHFGKTATIPKGIHLVPLPRTTARRTTLGTRR